MHREGTNPTYRSSYGSWISSKMYSCGSCFLWSCFSSQILVMYFHVPKINDEKKICVCKEKCTRPGCGRAFGARPPHPRNGPDTTPLPYPNGQNPGKTEVRLGSCVGVGLTSGTAVEQTDYRQTPTPPTARWLRKQEGEEMPVASTDSKKIGVGWDSCGWRVPYC